MDIDLHYFLVILAIVVFFIYISEDYKKNYFLLQLTDPINK
jgi:hypothetical protein